MTTARARPTRLILAAMALVFALPACTTTTTTKKPRNPHHDQADITQREPSKRYSSQPEK